MFFPAAGYHAVFPVCSVHILIHRHPSHLGHRNPPIFLVAMLSPDRQKAGSRLFPPLDGTSACFMLHPS